MRRIGLGCLRLEEASKPVAEVPGHARGGVAGDNGGAPRDGGRAADARGLARATIRAAVEARVACLDTARTYDETLIRGIELPPGLTIVTKCGMRREGDRWEPDGRASTILADAEASVAALGRVPDLLLLHAPDPKMELATSVRALAKAQALGLARAVGLSNVTRAQIESAASVAPIAAVECALGPYDDAAARGGVVAWCTENRARFFAYYALGGPRRAPRMRKDDVLRRVAAKHATSAAAVMLAYLLSLSPEVVPLVGARTPDALRGALEAERLVFDDEDFELLDARFPGLGRRRIEVPREPTAEVVLLMGLPGAGKSRLAAGYAGYTRLNRDELGGTLKGIAQRLGNALDRGDERVLLDNTYVSRASRSDVVRVAHARGAAVRCVHLDTAIADAQVNLTQRMLERHGELLGGKQLQSKTDPGLFAPTTLFRMERELERPAMDEGFVAIETRRFERVPGSGTRRALVLPVEIAARHAHREPDATVLVFGFGTHPRPAIERPFELAFCTHGVGPPTCWCRPPLPGLVLDFARRNDVDLRASILVAFSSAHRTMGTMLGMRVE